MLRVSVVVALLASLVACAGPAVTPGSSVGRIATPRQLTPWKTGRELMEILTDQYGYEWYTNTTDDGRQIFDSKDPTSDSAEPWIRVLPSFDEPATVNVFSRADEIAEGSRHIERVTNELTPDSASWVTDAVQRGSEWESEVFTDTTTTETGGQVGVSVVRMGHGLVIILFSPRAFPGESDGAPTPS